MPAACPSPARCPAPCHAAGQAQIDQIGVLMVLTVIVRIMLVADGSAYLQRHVPVAHQPAADLIPIDEQMLIHQPGRHVGLASICRQMSWKCGGKI